MEVVGSSARSRTARVPLNDTGCAISWLCSPCGVTCSIPPVRRGGDERLVAVHHPSVDEGGECTGLQDPAAELHAAFLPIARPFGCFRATRTWQCSRTATAGEQHLAESPLLGTPRLWSCCTGSGRKHLQQPASDTDVRDPNRLPPYAQPANVYRCDLGADVGCWMPTVLYADTGGTLPHDKPDIPARRPNPVRFSAAHRRARLRR